MSDSNRRTFLALGSAGAAAGVVALTGLGPAAEASETRRKSSSAHDRVVAYVEDHNSSRLSLMVGEREIVVHDRDLVHRILNAAGGE